MKCPVGHEYYSDELLTFVSKTNLVTEEFISNSPTIAFRSPIISGASSFQSFSTKTCAARERYEESLSSLQNAVTVRSNRPFVVAELARVQAEAGKPDDARQILLSLETASAENYIAPVNLAKIHLGLGEHDKVFEWLTKEVEERSVRMPYFMIDPQCDPIRSDDRFVSIADRMGISPRS